MYQYIFALYKKIYLNKIVNEYKSKKDALKFRSKFLEFTKNIWIYDITDNDTGNLMQENWSNALRLEKLYLKIKSEYDLIYKESNIDKSRKINRSILVGIALLVIINVLNLMF